MLEVPRDCVSIRKRHTLRFLLIGIFLCMIAMVEAAPRQTSQTDFARLAERIAGIRLAGGDDDLAALERALSMLDAVIIPALDSAKEPPLAALNQRLAELVSTEPGAGESFTVMRLTGRGAGFALAANFSLAGPSAVRVYAGSAGKYSVAGRIDRSTQKDFFDEYLEVVPIPSAADVPGLFVTVTGRTDGLQTGSFAAWSFDGARLKAVWASDVLQQSTYEVRADGFRLTYCAESDEADPRKCLRMVRDRYTWSGTEWKRAEQAPVSVSKQ